MNGDAESEQMLRRVDEALRTPAPSYAEGERELEHLLQKVDVAVRRAVNTQPHARNLPQPGRRIPPRAPAPPQTSQQKASLSSARLASSRDVLLRANLLREVFTGKVYTPGWTIFEGFEIPGNSLYMAYKPTGQFTIDRLNEIDPFTGSQAGPDGLPVKTLFQRDNWGQGWTTFMPFEVNGLVHYLAYDKKPGASGGRVSIDRIDLVDRNGKKVLQINNVYDRKAYTTGWTIFMPFRLDGNPFYLAYKSETGQLTVDRFRTTPGQEFGINSSDGSPVDTLFSAPDWGKGWTTFMPFTTNGVVHYLAYNKNTGRVSIDRIDLVIRKDATGQLGRVVEIKNVYDQVAYTPGWTTFVPFEYEGRAHYLAYKEQTGEVSIDRICNGAQADPDTGWPVEVMFTDRWSPGWTSFLSFKMNERPHFFAYANPQTPQTAFVTTARYQTTLDSFVKNFEQKVSIPDLVSDGQFFWGQKLLKMIDDETQNRLNLFLSFGVPAHRVVTARSDLEALKKVLFEDGDLFIFTSIFSNEQDRNAARDRIVAAERQFLNSLAPLVADRNTLVQSIARDIGQRYENIVNFNLQQGRNVFNALWARLISEDKQNYTSDEFKRLYLLPATRPLRMNQYVSLRRAEAEQCFSVAGRMVRYLRRRQRLKGPAPTSPQLNVDGNILLSRSRIKRGNAPEHSVLLYSTFLNQHVQMLKRVVDDDFYARVAVVSGLEPNQANFILNPDHFILVIGCYHTDTFIFWDPDAGASKATSYGRGFGLLYYDRSANRLTTAKDSADIAVNTLGDHFDREQHRYQAVALQRMP